MSAPAVPPYQSSYPEVNPPTYNFADGPQTPPNRRSPAHYSPPYVERSFNWLAAGLAATIFQIGSYTWLRSLGISNSVAVISSLAVGFFAGLLAGASSRGGSTGSSSSSLLYISSGSSYGSGYQPRALFSGHSGYQMRFGGGFRATSSGRAFVG